MVFDIHLHIGSEVYIYNILFVEIYNFVCRMFENRDIYSKSILTNAIDIKYFMNLAFAFMTTYHATTCMPHVTTSHTTRDGDDCKFLVHINCDII